MKKIIALFVLMLFVISTMVSAQRDMAAEKISAQQNRQEISTKNYIQRRMELKERVGDLTPEQAQVLRNLDRERLRECLEDDTPKDCLNQYRIKKYTNKAEMFRVRTVKNYQAMRSNLESLKNKYGQIKDDVGEYREAFKNAVQTGDEEAAIDAAKDYLIHVGDLVINNLERVKEQVALSDDLTQEEVDEILEDLDEQIEEIEDAQADVEAAETKEEVKEAGQEIVDAWKRMKHKVKTHAAKVIKASVKDVYRRAKFLEGKLEKGLERLAENGYDTSVADDLMEDYSEKLESAKDNFEAAEEKFKEARETTGDGEAVSSLVEEAREYLHAANEDMKEANRLAREILKTVRELGAPVEELTAESDEDYVEIEEIECESDDDCEEGEYCDDNECEDLDEEDEEEDEEETEEDTCTTDEECEEDEVCTEGECEEEEDVEVFCDVNVEYDNTAVDPVACECPDEYDFMTVSTGFGPCPTEGMSDCPMTVLKCVAET